MTLAGLACAEDGGFVVPHWFLGAAIAVLVALAIAFWALELAARAPISLKGSLIIITGAGGDIGSEVARLAARKGAWVATWDSSSHRLSNVLTSDADLAERVVHSSVFDVTDDHARRAALGEALAKYSDKGIACPRVVLVNNAGIVDGQPIQRADPAVLSRVVTVDLMAPLLLMSELARFAAKGAVGGQPAQFKVVNVSSVMGLLGAGRLTSYSAAKAGLAMASESAQLDAESDGLWPRLSVLTVFPYAVSGVLFRGIYGADEGPGRPRAAAPTASAGWLSILAAITPQDNFLRSLMFPLLSPSDVGEAVISGIESGARTLVVPWLIGVVVAIARLFPPSAMALLAGVMGGWRGMDTWKGGRGPTCATPKPDGPAVSPSAEGADTSVRHRTGAASKRRS